MHPSSDEEKMYNHKAFALIPAAGMGKRMGAAINKQYLDLSGQPVLARTIAAFEQSTAISGIILVIPESEIGFCREQIVNKFGFTKIIDIVAGGAERQQSVFNGLEALAKHAAADDIVLIHDGARPFVNDRMINESIQTATSYDCALVAVPCKDTIKIVSDMQVKSTPARETLWQAQTPQTFKYQTIVTAHRRCLSDALAVTDDASLIEYYNGIVKIVPGDYRNIKITTPEDLILAEAFLADSRQEVL